MHFFEGGRECRKLTYNFAFHWLSHPHGAPSIQAKPRLQSGAGRTLATDALQTFKISSGSQRGLIILSHPAPALLDLLRFFFVYPREFVSSIAHDMKDFVQRRSWRVQEWPDITAAAMPSSRIEIYWKKAELAPDRVIAQVRVTDGSGSDYLLPYPCKLTSDGWVNATSGKQLAVRVTYWKPYVETPKRKKPAMPSPTPISPPQMLRTDSD